MTRMELPGNADDKQARYLEAAIDGILVGCIYLPNGNPQPGPKFDYKLAWFRRLNAHARKLLREDIPVVLAGDFNVAPTELDIYPTTSWDDDALVQPQSRAAYARLLKQGWTDAIRETHGEERVYTFWHYLRHRWERNAGLRLDHILLSPDLAPRLRAAGVDRAVRGRPGRATMHRCGSNSPCRSDVDGQRDGATSRPRASKGWPSRARGNAASTLGPPNTSS